MLAEQQKYVDLAKDIVLKYIDPNEFDVFLFGSRAREKHRFAADIDVGVIGNILLSAEVIYNIKEEIEESIVPFAIDIVDFSQVEASFKKVALAHFIIWNQSKYYYLNFKP